MDEVASIFRERYGSAPRVVLAPGRVNLIGEHTDYNDGFVLPAAIDRHVVVAFATNDTGLLRGYSMAVEDERSAPLVGLTPSGSSSTWFDHAAGVAWSLQGEGLELDGLDFVVGADLPMAAGLSSSAALELGIARALLHDRPWDAAAMARLAHRAENDYVGLPCGVMDHFVVALGKRGHSLLIDCRHQTSEAVPIPERLSVVVLDTGTRRALVESAYGERMQSCREAASAMGVRSLRDATPDALERVRIDETSRRRARHVLRENERTLRMVEALRSEDVDAIGDLMAASHESLRDLYEVSTAELDTMVTLAKAHPSAVGARMTGAGFGGSAVALVERDGEAAFVTEVEAAYHGQTGKSGKLFACRSEDGVRLLPSGSSGAARRRG